MILLNQKSIHLLDFNFGYIRIKYKHSKIKKALTDT